MRLVLLIASLSCVILASSASGQGPTQVREKICEGKYQKYRNGKLTGEGIQTWALWRTSDGRYELEDHFHLADPFAEIFARFGTAGGRRMSENLSQQLRQEIQGQVSQSEIDVKLSANFAIESLTVRGTRLLDGKAVELETCFIAAEQIQCKGQSGKAHLHTSQPQEFFFSFPFPMLAVGLIQRAATPTEGAMNLSVMNLLPFNRPKLKLESCRGQVRMIGEDQIQLGEKNYKVSKYVLEVASKIESLKLSFFLNKNLVVAIADSRIPSERLQLVEYKKFSDF